jgi:hypothetical protein
MLSRTSKLGCYSWSLQAWDTCPGSKDSTGEAVPACKVCYARQGMYHMPNVKAVRAFNLQDWRNSDWVDRMVSSLSKQKFFRWFDSGDMYHIQLAEKIYAVMNRTPNCQHWLPTRMYKFPKFQAILRSMHGLSNVTVRASSDEVDGSVLDTYLNSSTIIPDRDYKTEAYVCPAYKQGGKCLTCRQCWDKMTPVVAYPYHGKSKAKVIKLIQIKG